MKRAGRGRARGVGPWAALVLAVSLGGMLAPAGGAAQGASGPASWLGAAETSAALLRGLDAAALNPAALPVGGSVRYEVRVPGLAVEAGLHPIGLRDLGSFQGRELSRELREGWVRRAEAAGGWMGAGAASATPLAARVGPLAFGVRSSARVRAAMSSDAAELVFFGNSGRHGETRAFSVDGSHFDGAAYTTLAVAGATALERATRGRLTLGTRLTWTLGHALALGRDAGTLVGERDASLELRFPIVESSGSEGTVGRGFGLDLGALWVSGPWDVSVSAANLVSTFSWDRARLRFRSGTAHYREGDAAADFESRPLSEAPPAVRAAVEELRFGRTLELAAARRIGDDLALTGSTMRRFGGGLSGRPSFLVGGGVEHRRTSLATLRAGVAAITGGAQGGAGVGLGGERLSFDGAVILRSDDYGRRVLASLSLSLRSVSARGPSAASGGPAGG